MAAELTDLLRGHGAGTVRLLLVSTAIALSAVAFSIIIAYLYLVPTILTVREVSNARL